MHTTDRIDRRVRFAELHVRLPLLSPRRGRSSASTVPTLNDNMQSLHGTISRRASLRGRNAAVRVHNLIVMPPPFVKPKDYKPVGELQVVPAYKGRAVEVHSRQMPAKAAGCP